MCRRIGRLFPIPPGLTWRFLWLPVGWAFAMGAVWGVVQWQLYQHGNLSPDTAFSSGQVFTGLAGIGAAVVALAGIAKQFEVPSPRLELTLSDLAAGPIDIAIRNSGSADAHGVVLAFSPCDAGLDWRHDDARWDVTRVPGPPSRIELRRVPPLVPHAELHVRRVGVPPEVTSIALSAENSPPVTVGFRRGRIHASLPRLGGGARGEVKGPD